MPSPNQSSILSTYFAEGYSELICAKADETTQRWFGVWIPPVDNASPAASTNFPSLLLMEESWGKFMRCSTARAVQSVWTTNAYLVENKDCRNRWFRRRAEP